MNEINKISEIVTFFFCFVVNGLIKEYNGTFQVSHSFIIMKNDKF